jgi:hypothetical protein
MGCKNSIPILMGANFVNTAQKNFMEIWVGIEIEKPRWKNTWGCANMLFSSFVPAGRGGALPSRETSPCFCNDSIFQKMAINFKDSAEDLGLQRTIFVYHL